MQVLEADNNKIENLEGVYQLPKLEEVHLRNNGILACVTEVFGFLIYTFKSFVRIYCALLTGLSVWACYFHFFSPIAIFLQVLFSRGFEKVTNQLPRSDSN